MTTSDVPGPDRPSTTLLESIDHTRSSMLEAVRTGIIAYGAVWVVTLLIGGAALLSVALEDENPPLSSYLTAPGQAIAMSSHGTFDLTTTIDFDDEFSEDEDFSEDEGFSEDEDFSGSDEGFSEDEEGNAFGVSTMDESFTSSTRFSAISLTVLGIVIGALWVANRRSERRRRTSSPRAALAAAAVTAMTFAAVTWAVAFAARVRIDGSSGHAGTLSILFYASVLGTVVGLVARRPAAGRRMVARLPFQLTESLRGVAVYFVTFALLLVPTAAIYAITQGEPDAILMFPLVILNIAVYAITLGQFAGVELYGVPFESGPNFFWLFSQDVEGILYAAIPLSIAALALAAAVVARRSAGRPRTSFDAFWLVVTFAATGALLTYISALDTSTSTFGLGEGGGGMIDVSLAAAPWLFLVMAAWGVVTEVAIRTVGRPLAALVPDRIMDRLAGS